MNIRYEEYGTSNRNHILFIHGLGSSLLVWRDFPEALSNEFHSIAIDLPGFGESDKPKENYTISFFSQSVKDFVDQINFEAEEKISIIRKEFPDFTQYELTDKMKEIEDIYRFLKEKKTE